MQTSTFLLVSTTLIVALTQGAYINNPEDDLRKTQRCLRQSDVSFTTLSRVNSGNFDNDPKLKEYFWCINKNTGFQNEAGDLQMDVIRDKLKGGHYNDDTIEEVVRFCTSRKESPQETAYHFMRCVYGSTMPKKYT